MADGEDRLTAVETALAHQERVAEELSEVVRDLAERLARLERRMAALADHVLSLEDGGAAPSADKPPPHW